MRSRELVRLLKKNERSQAWLGRKLKLTAMAICKYCSGEIPISQKREKQIRKILK
jgi:hypothetical protein